MFMIGIDPHKGSHTAVAVDRSEVVLGTLRVDADRHQRARLLAWAEQFEPRTWAIEGATGMGALLAQQLVAAGEHVVDVPPKLSSRVRLLEAGRIDKTDPNDARSAAIVAWRNPTLNVIVTNDEDRVVCRLLADRDHQITAQRTRTICRLHALLCLLVEGGTRRALTTAKAADVLHSVSIDSAVTAERVATARQMLDEIAVLDQARLDVRRRTAAVVVGSRTTLTDIHGIGPVIAAIIIGRVGDIHRFPTAGHFARHNGTAPIEASSGPKKRHRLNPRGDRQLNHAIHMAAVTQVGHDTPGRVYYLRKQAEAKTRKEALRCLKRRISDAVYARLIADARSASSTSCPSTRPD
jgi:transposase